jgi:predicted RNase H-like HicB family nuclease
MKRTFTASVWQESNWFIAQCLEIDIASQGETETEALANLEEALSLFFVERELFTQLVYSLGYISLSLNTL